MAFWLWKDFLPFLEEGSERAGRGGRLWLVVNLLLLSVWGAGSSRRPESFLTRPWGGQERVCLPPGTLRSMLTPFPPALLGDTRCVC